MNSTMTTAALTPAATAGDARERVGGIGAAPRNLLVALSVLVVGAFLVLAVGDVAPDLDYHATIRALKHTSGSAITWALGATALSFVALIARDASAMRYIGVTISAPALFLAGFCGSALGNAAGLGGLTAAAVRYRVYGALGVKTEVIARLLLFILGGFVLGLASVGALATLWETPAVAGMFGASPTVLRLGAAATLAMVALLFVFGLHGPIRVGGFTLAPPSRASAVLQLLLTAARLGGAALALWVLLPTTPLNFLAFAALFAAATALGAVSHVPGGLGVFEAVVLWALRGKAPVESVAAALIAFRFVYFGAPLLLSAVLFAGFELVSAARSHKSREADPLARAAHRLSPAFLGALTFAAGMLLIVSGATPAFGKRLAILSLHVPLWAVESSSFLGSLVGVVLLFVARGLIDRRDAAWRIAVSLSFLSLAFSLVKGLAFFEAGLFLVLTMLLLATRPQFNRPTSMLDQPFTYSWYAAVGVIIVAAFGVSTLAFDAGNLKASELWWRFAFDAQGPRALRALIGSSALALGFAVSQLLRAPKGAAKPPTPAEIEAAMAIAAAQDRSEAGLAAMGDKSFLVSTSGRSFLMFGKRGRSWIALFDPVGPREEWPELIHRFVGLADEHAGRAAFYQIPSESLPLYLDSGLTVMKLGEEARVSLSDFSMAGGAMKDLRYALKRGARDGLSFEFLPPDRALALMPDLEAISNEWLEERSGEEKGFSVAAFAPAFLKAQGIGLVRANGEPVAFVSVMTTETGREATLALMRHRTGVSAYAMEFLLVETILVLKAQGLQTFSLGVAPLSGVRQQPLSSRWHWLGSQIWKHGDRFYNFQGLRTFKSKFAPTWAPRYLAASGTVGPFVALADAAALIARPPQGKAEG